MSFYSTIITIIVIKKLKIIKTMWITLLLLFRIRYNARKYSCRGLEMCTGCLLLDQQYCTMKTLFVEQMCKVVV